VTSFLDGKTAQRVELCKSMTMKPGHLKAMLHTKAEEWRGLLRKHAPIARQMVRKLVEGRIVFTPDPEARRYTFLATGTLANFFSGIVCPQAVASPTSTAEMYELPIQGDLRNAA
jgi:hypothetical protein